MFPKKTGSKSHCLRSSSKDLQLPKVRSEHMKNSFAFTGAKLWNSLPSELKEVQSLQIFKKKIEHHKFCADNTDLQV